MSKRALSEHGGAGGSSPPKKKQAVVQFEPIHIMSSTVDELDTKVLQFQNKRLSERLQDRKQGETELRNKIEQLEQRLTADDSIILIVNRYWNQLDENVRVMLDRFDGDTAETDAVYNESEPLKTFLSQLSSVDSEELTDKLKQRVEFSKWAVGKLLQAYDKQQWRYDRLVSTFKKKPELMAEEEDEKKEKQGDEAVKEAHEKVKKAEAEVKVLKEDMSALKTENTRLQGLVTSLHEKHHTASLALAEVEDKLSAEETRGAEHQNSALDLQWRLEQTQARVYKLEHALADAAQKVKAGAVAGGLDIGSSSIPRDKADEASELEEVRDLADNRLKELQKLQAAHQESLKTVERLNMDLKTLPESCIKESTEYKCLQSQFSVLYNEAMTMRGTLEETRAQLQNTRTLHHRQIQRMEEAELEQQSRYKDDMLVQEATIAQQKREYESLRVEFEQLLAANEQTGPINREMRQLITNLQSNNRQQKGEVNRYRRKCKDLGSELAKLKALQEKEVLSMDVKKEGGDAASKAGGAPAHPEGGDSKKEEKEEGEIKDEIKQEPTTPARDKSREREEGGKGDTETERRLKQELKKRDDSLREYKLLLDMHKSAPKEQREKAELLSSERRVRGEMEDLRRQIRRLELEKAELERKERRQVAESEAVLKLRKMEDINTDLHRQMDNQKQGEEAILKELEVTGQAYEELEEQNARLLQQLREKDDANFKLLSDRVKSAQVVKLMKEEKEVLVEQLTQQYKQLENQRQVIRDLEETDRTLRTAVAHLEKEATLRQQSLDLHKRKAVESAQTAADLKLHADKYHNQLREAQTALQDRTAALQQETYKYRRLQEELASSSRKLERAQKMQAASSADEVLLEENREYKEQLTCPSCKVKRKDAVLTKCYHVFCLECLKTRYETRQRKCPKCNAGFGANDYRRLYLE